MDFHSFFLFFAPLTQEHHADTGYYYNAIQRWYYDLKSKMYYGGDPADWTNTPPIPKEALYGASRDPPSRIAPIAGSSGARPAAAASTTGGSSVSVTATTTAAVGNRIIMTGRVPQTILPGQKAVAAHPLAGIGGYQMPEIGRIGGAKGFGAGAGASGSGDGVAGVGGKRSREEKKISGDGGRDSGKGGAVPAKPLSKEEAEFLARREAARQRVQKRSMQTFGLG